MAQINSVIIIQKLNLKAQSVTLLITAHFLDAMLRRKVPDLAPIAVPADAPLALRFLRVNQRLHALVVGGIRLEEVDDVEGVFLIGARIPHAKVKPLGEQRVDGAEV